MNPDQLRSVSDALHNGAEPGEVWGKIAPKHAPLPWHREPYGGSGSDQSLVRAANGQHVCYCDRPAMDSGPLNKANAELICRAVNAHDELLAACKLALAEYDWGRWEISEDDETNPSWHAIRALRAIIARAERAEGKEE